MNDDEPAIDLEALKAEHRELDERRRAVAEEGTGDEFELARMKKRKLYLKDQIQKIAGSRIPDIIA